MSFFGGGGEAEAPKRDPLFAGEPLPECYPVCVCDCVIVLSNPYQSAKTIHFVDAAPMITMSILYQDLF